MPDQSVATIAAQLEAGIVLDVGFTETLHS